MGYCFHVFRPSVRPVRPVSYLSGTCFRCQRILGNAAYLDMSAELWPFVCFIVIKLSFHSHNWEWFGFFLNSWVYFCTAFVAHSNKTYVTDKNITFQLRPIFTYKDVQLHILPLPPSTCSVPCPGRLFMFGPLTFFLSHTAMLRPLLITVVIDNNLKIVNFTWHFVLKSYGPWVYWNFVYCSYCVVHTLLK